MIGRRELVCRELVEMVTEYLEGSLRSRDRRRFERHIAQCADCLRYVDQIKLTTHLEQLTHEDEAAIPAELLALFRSHAAQAEQ
jgi:predicted anti-sigma-YlaC factor YlaD